jgi:hypothetical protein
MNKMIDPPHFQIAVQRIICTGCGAEANAACMCGVSYVPKAIRAAEAVKANPGKSDRAAEAPGPSPFEARRVAPSTPG